MNKKSHAWNGVSMDLKADMLAILAERKKEMCTDFMQLIIICYIR